MEISIPKAAYSLGHNSVVFIYLFLLECEKHIESIWSFTIPVVVGSTLWVVMWPNIFAMGVANQ